jgi:signal transduction histidine kinase
LTSDTTVWVDVDGRAGDTGATAWHLEMLIALIHAASAEARAGRVPEEHAGAALVATVLGAMRQVQPVARLRRQGIAFADLRVASRLMTDTATFDVDSTPTAALDELRELTAELQASRTRIVEAADEARRRIERHLHDGAQQRLVAAALQLGIAMRAIERGELGQIGELLGRVRDELDSAWPSCATSPAASTRLC